MIIKESVDKAWKENHLIIQIEKYLGKLCQKKI